MLVQNFARLLVSGIIILAASAAEAQPIELSTMKCKEFIDLPRETIVTLTIWLDGYYTDEEEAAVVEFDKLRMKADKLVSFCAQNPKTGLMMAAENVMAK
jgi:acid stress chaperone HdeB